MTFSYPPNLRGLLEELDAEGTRHDATDQNRATRWLSITPDTGAFLWAQVRLKGARNVLELGSSHGYSTIWLASAVEGQEGSVTSVDVDARKTEAARANVKRAGLEGAVTWVTADAGAFLNEGPVARWDFIFLDAERKAYPSYWANLWRSLRPDGVLVVDNAVSHAEELAPFVECIRQEPSAHHVLVPVGKGELVVVKAARAAR